MPASRWPGGHAQPSGAHHTGASSPHAQVVVCEAHSVPGGAAHCWERNGCSFDSGTALFFGLPGRDMAAAAAGAAAAAAQLAPSSGGSGGGGGSGLRAAAGGRRPRVADNPLTAVLALVGEELDLIPYGPEATSLVFPEGTFRSQARRTGGAWGAPARARDARRRAGAAPHARAL